MPVTFDAVGPSSSGASSAGSTTLTWSHTIGAGSTRWLRIDIAVGQNPEGGIAVDAVTFNGVAASFIAQRHSNDQAAGFIESWGLVAPASGTHTVSVTLSGAAWTIIGGSRSYDGVDQTTPYRNATSAAGNSALASVTVASASGNMVGDAVAAGRSLGTSNQTSRWLRNVNGDTGAGNAAAADADGASSVSLTRTVTSDWWASIGLDIVAAGGGGSTVGRLVGGTLCGGVLVGGLLTGL